MTTHTGPVSPTTAYEVLEGWEQLPEGWSHPDVAGVAVDADDRVFVFARADHPVSVYTPGGTLSTTWGEGVFTNPHMVRIDHEGNVWCVDNGDYTVRKFTAEGELLMTLRADSSLGQPDRSITNYRQVKAAGPPFNAPTDVCVLKDGTFFVTDGYRNARVHRFSPDGSLEMSWGEPGSEPGQFNLPHNIVASPDESRLYVADRENSRIQVFDLDGTFVDQWLDVPRPCGLAVSAVGEVFVAQLGDRAGRFPWTRAVDEMSPISTCTVRDPGGSIIVEWGTADAVASGSFFAAHTIAPDSSGDLYVGEVTWSAGGKRGEVPEDCHTLQKFRRR
jgi:DNA-binding beta-propeller fold protein YncE